MAIWKQSSSDNLRTSGAFVCAKATALGSRNSNNLLISLIAREDWRIQSRSSKIIDERSASRQRTLPNTRTPLESSHIGCSLPPRTYTQRPRESFLFGGSSDRYVNSACEPAH